MYPDFKGSFAILCSNGYLSSAKINPPSTRPEDLWKLQPAHTLLPAMPMPWPTSANSVKQRCPSKRDNPTIVGFTPISSRTSSEHIDETCESSSPPSGAHVEVFSSGCLSLRQSSESMSQFGMWSRFS